MDTGAIFSDCNQYRFKLWRFWNLDKPLCMFLMLNPSIADETTNDPTVERCQRYATEWGYGGLFVGNIFAFRATYRKDMKAAPDPIGSCNDSSIMSMAAHSKIIVAAWGNDGQHLDRSTEIKKLFMTYKWHLYCLAVTKAGEPGHPLYLQKRLTPMLYL